MTVNNEFGQPIRSLCFTAEQDRLLALGYPHLRLLDEVHKDDKAAEKMAVKAAFDRGVPYRVRCPRSVANRFVRAARSEAFQDWTSRKTVKPADHALCADGATVDAAEARELILASIAVPGCTFLRRYEDLFLLLEALVGTGRVVDAILDGLEGLPERRFTHENGPDRKTGGPIFLLGFLVLRLLPAAREAALGRLAALDARVREWTDAAGSQSWEITQSMDLVLRGSKAGKLDGKGPYTYLDWFAHAGDDPDLLRRVAGNKDTVYAGLDVRFVYLAGPEILDVLGKRRPRADEVPRFLEDIGMIKAPAVVSLMLEYVGKASAKKAPMQWLLSHAEYARPVLEARAKKGGAAGETAQMVLAGLAAPPPPVASKKAKRQPA